MSPGRRAALNVLQATERGQRLDRALDEHASHLDARERAFTHELTYGATRLRNRLDHLLSRHLRDPIQYMDSELRDVLRLGAYQLLYMSVPGYAAVSQTVEHAKKVAGERPAKMVNAVLRKVGEDGDAPHNFPGEASNPAAFLSSWGSHPGWLVGRWLRRWSTVQVRALIEADNARPSTFLVPLDTGPDRAVEVLGAGGIEAEPVYAGTACVRLAEGARPIEALSVLPHAIVQDPAANLVCAYADIPRGTKVADLCAAPGGKLLAVCDRALYTLAADRSEARLNMVRDNARRAGRRIGMVVADARRPPLSEVDVVLLDAPCSGTGTLARKPDARWRVAPTTIVDLAELQSEMLDAAADVVGPGGLLVYSTCTLEPEENEEQVNTFLDRRRDFVLEPSDVVPPRYLDDAGRLFVTPQATGFDGAFAARLRKVG